jgi:hypothetical protein
LNTIKKNRSPSNMLFGQGGLHVTDKSEVRGQESKTTW